MKVLVMGSRGQLGSELEQCHPQNWETCWRDLDECDLTSAEAVDATFASIEPDLVINAAAYTAVDNAESEHEAAFRVNADAVAHLVRSAIEYEVRLIHISTDFVFDGASPHPYKPDAQVNPLSVYGTSKARGEAYVTDLYPHNSVIIRTSWLYSRHGTNFVKTMLRLLAEHETVNVVADQIGSPTSARGLADAIWKIAAIPGVSGIYHWSDSGVASWYDFACAIKEEALALGLLRRAAAVLPIPTADYPTPAKRPPCCVLDKSATWELLDYKSPHWREALRSMLIDMRNAQNA